jgi:hypothetical protein
MSTLCEQCFKKTAICPPPERCQKPHPEKSDCPDYEWDGCYDVEDDMGY